MSDAMKEGNGGAAVGADVAIDEFVVFTPENHPDVSMVIRKSRVEEGRRYFAQENVTGKACAHNLGYCLAKADIEFINTHSSYINLAQSDLGAWRIVYLSYYWENRKWCKELAMKVANELNAALGLRTLAKETILKMSSDGKVMYTPDEIRAVAKNPVYCGDDCEIHLQPEVVPMLNAFAAMLGRIADRRLRNAEIKDMSVPLAYDLNVQLDYVLNGNGEE